MKPSLQGDWCDQSVQNNNAARVAAAILSLALQLFPAGATEPAASVQVASATAQSFAEMQRRVTDGQFEAAYKLGKTMHERLGDPHFDFLFGVAAVHSGRTPEGVLALERHLAAIPGNDRARLELARGYFELGDYIRARQEFEFVLRYQPPPSVRTNIERYLDAMRTRDALANRMSSRAYLEAGLGHDSNVNAGTYNSTIQLPNGPVVIADSTSRGVASRYFNITGGAQWVRRVSPPFSVFAGGDFDIKHNLEATRFDTAHLSGHAGFSMISGASLYRLTLADSIMQVDGTRYRNILSATGELQQGLGEGLMINALVQHSEQSHTGENSIRDARALTLGGGLQKTFAGDWRTSIGMQLSLTDESNLNKRADLSRHILSARLFLAVNPTDRVGLSLSAGRQFSEFQAPDIAFNTTRSDQLTSVDLGLNYSLSKSWVIRAEVQWSENASNQDLYPFHRTYGLIKTRYLF